MIDEALVRSYVQGQVGRRAFVRGLVRSGVSLSAAIAYAGTLGANPALADHTAGSDVYNEDALVTVKYSSMNPVVARVMHGGLVQWTFVYDHTTDNRGYGLSDPMQFIKIGEDQHHFYGGFRSFRFFCAGTFGYTVTASRRIDTGVYVDHVDHPGVIESLLRLSQAKVERNKTVTIKWATKAAPAGYVYDVQIDRPGESWADWRRGTDEKERALAPKEKGTYRFRARIRRPSDFKYSGWSPVRSLEVV